MTTMLSLLIIILSDGTTLPPELMRSGRCRMDAIGMQQMFKAGYELREIQSNTPIASVECRPIRIGGEV